MEEHNRHIIKQLWFFVRNKNRRKSVLFVTTNLKYFEFLGMAKIFSRKPLYNQDKFKQLLDWKLFFYSIDILGHG